MKFRRCWFFGLVLLGGLSGVAPARAQSDDTWLLEMTLLLEEHFQPEGRLVINWARRRPEVLDDESVAMLRFVQPPHQLARQMVLRTRVTRVDGSTSDHSMVVHAALWQQGWTLVAPAETRTPVRPSLVQVTEFNALRHRDILAGELPDELDFSRNLPAGHLLTWRDVMRRPLVRRNEPVEVIASDGALTVTLRGIALHDAARGESVRVRNPDTRREFTAIVSEPARAKVQF